MPERWDVVVLGGRSLAGPMVQQAVALRFADLEGLSAPPAERGF